MGLATKRLDYILFSLYLPLARFGPFVIKQSREQVSPGNGVSALLFLMTRVKNLGKEHRNEIPPISAPFGGKA